MSFADGATVNARSRPTQQQPGNNDQEHKRIEENVKKITQIHVAAIQSEKMKLNMPNYDINGSRKRVNEEEKKATKMVREVQTSLERIQNSSLKSSIAETKQRKLKQDLTNAVAELRKVCTEHQDAASAAVASAAASPRSRPPIPREDSSCSGVSMQPLLDGSESSELPHNPSSRKQAQEQDVSDAELRHHTEIAAEYVEKVTQLTEDVTILHGCMIDICAQVQDQGEVIDNIESQLQNAADSSDAANEQILQASQTQHTTNKRLCWMLLFIVLLAGVSIILVVALK